jgi:FkbM family methyltransferase
MADSPFFWRCLPDYVKASIYHRVLYPPSPIWHSLYERASLRFAPDMEVDLKPSDRMHGQIAFLGYYEKRLSEAIAQIGREKGGKFVDVGANIGYHTLLWVAQDPENEALAIEPSPRVVPLLRKNVRRNGVEERVTIMEAAAGKGEGEVSFDLGPREEVGWGGVTKGEGRTVTENSQGTVSVSQHSLDDVIEGPVGLLKVDVEGAETWVFQGSEDLLRSQEIERICFENNRVRARRLGIEKEEPSGILKEHGYKIDEKEDTLWAEPRD